MGILETIFGTIVVVLAGIAVIGALAGVTRDSIYI
jgi:hypothetical protein